MRERRRHRRRDRHLARRIGAVYSRLRAHSWRIAVAFSFCMVLSGIILTTSLPYVLAPAYPDLALALNPRNPDALLAKADKLRKQWLATAEAEGELDTQEGSQQRQRGGTIAGLPKATGANPGISITGRDGLRKEIQELAERAIANDPLNAKAFRFLGELTDNPEQMRLLMEEAVKRSRHETEALFYLLNDAFYHRDYRRAMHYANVLLRTSPELSQYILRYVSLIGEEPDGMPLVVEQLARAPSWRGQFFEILPRNARHIDTALKLMTALTASDKPVSAKELSPYLDVLIANNRVDAAYNAWLRFLPERELENIRLLTNGSFASDPSGLPFDWRLAQGVNASAEFVPLDAQGDERALFISFGTGRVRFPELSQMVMLPPGHYRLEGKLRGRIISKRGLRWQVRCASPKGELLGETDMLIGMAGQWRVFALAADVPRRADCVGQVLRLIHDSRSASEELISGEIWFAGLQVERLRAEPVPAENGLAAQQTAAP